MVFPVDSSILELEREQWRIFVAWNRRYESGEVGLGPHPGHGGIDPRWDELDRLLENDRHSIPADAKHARAEFKQLDREERYAEEGPDYTLCWAFL